MKGTPSETIRKFISVKRGFTTLLYIESYGTFFRGDMKADYPGDKKGLAGRLNRAAMNETAFGLIDFWVED